MSCAYAETYVHDAMNNLGDMLDYASNDLGYEPEDFYTRFLSSGVAGQFERGNPRYIAGMSGAELAGEVIFQSEGKRPEKEAAITVDRSPEYWAGWVLAYYQWLTGRSFSYIEKSGVSLAKVLSLYDPLHEADLTKFVSTADRLIRKEREAGASALKTIRLARGLSQKELAERAGVSLRMVQLYEQKRQDISRAEAQTLTNLSRTLGCRAEDLFE